MRAGICTECKTQMEWKETTMEFEGFGVKVKIEGIPVMACPKCGDESIPGPEAVKLSNAVDEILKAAKKTRDKVISTVA